MNDLLLKYFSDTLRHDERLALLSRIESDEMLKKEFIRMQNLTAITRLSPQARDSEESRINYLLFSKRLSKKNRRIRTINLLKYASVAVILIASTVASMILLQNISTDNTLNSLYVPPGQRAQITLQDGTKVWLNAQSTLTYPSRFSKRSRKVELTGEAFFDVASNKRTFIVTTQNIEMHVLGTRFNVSSYPNTNHVQADLVEGALKIHEVDGQERVAFMESNQKMVYSNNNMEISPITDPEHMLWKEGIYSFNNERLVDIIQKLALYYDVRIIIEDPELFNIRYTGKFRQRDGIDEILRILQSIQPFSVQKDKDNNTIRLI